MMRPLEFAPRATGGRERTSSWGGSASSHRASAARCLIPLLALPLLTGCGEEDDTPFDFTPSVERVATSGDDTTRRAAPVAARLVPIDTGAPLRAFFAANLVPANGTLGGTVRIEGIGSNAKVHTRLSGGLAGVSYDGGLRQGTCAAVGSRVAGLNPVTADSTGAGASFSDVDVEVRDLFDTPHVVVFGRGGSAETCGSLSRLDVPPPSDSSAAGP